MRDEERNGSGFLQEFGWKLHFNGSNWIDITIRKDFDTSRFRNSRNGCYKYGIGIDGNFLFSFFVVKLNKVELTIYSVNNLLMICVSFYWLCIGLHLYNSESFNIAAG